MKVFFCAPNLTMKNVKEANTFYDGCKEILDGYIADTPRYVNNELLLHQSMTGEVEQNDILCFFSSEDGKYDASFLRFIGKFNDCQCRIWAIAIYGNPECRMPPEPVSEKQSFDVSHYMENRTPYNNNIRAIAQLFARKIVAQTLSPLYRDEVLYFISHRRLDGEHITARLTDQLNLLTRERNIYRDVVQVKVGDYAQKDIERNLRECDIVIFLQTPEAKKSEYIVKELLYAITNNIPVLWIQIDDADYSEMEIYPSDKPMLSYKSEDFDSEERLIKIADEIEENCFRLIMNSSSQVFSYVEDLSEFCKKYNYKFSNVRDSILAYEIEYRTKHVDRYDSGIRRHYIQYFGRNPKKEDIIRFKEDMQKKEVFKKNDKLLLLSSHGDKEKGEVETKFGADNYDNYLLNLERVSGKDRHYKNRKIILSGAFPDYDEIYKQSLLEALTVYSREILRNGYTLVFGAHPTFQKIIFDIANTCVQELQQSVEMHMSREYISQYNVDDLKENCKLVLSDDLQKMRETMICQDTCALLICLGGKIKENKAEQGVDIEVELAKKAGIPVALVGTVGGRSSQYAYERIMSGDWSDLNKWDKSLNESLFYKVNHRIMIKKLLNELEEGETRNA